MDETEPIYGVVTFEGEERRSISEIAMAFEDAKAADEFARSAGADDYAVGPVAFVAIAAAASVRWRGPASR